MKRQNLRTVSLIVVTFTYLLFGAAIFGYLESEHEVRQREHLELIELIVKRKYNISEDDFTVLTTTVIKSVPHKAGIQWKFPGAFYFATTVVTTIGYGHSTPATMAGRSFCMIYALIGIPLGLVMFQSIGERLNTIVGWALRNAKRCLKAKNQEVTQTNLVMVVSVLSTLLMTGMAAVFASYERWDYFDALYYCFITLTTIGFGDYVALQKESALQSKPEYVALSLVFILFGLSVVSSAVNLLVLKFLTLNTEDERRDEQLRYTANLNPIQLEGDVITSASGALHYATPKRKLLAGGGRRADAADSQLQLDASSARSSQSPPASTKGSRRRRRPLDPPAPSERLIGSPPDHDDWCLGGRRHLAPLSDTCQCGEFVVASEAGELEDEHDLGRDEDEKRDEHLRGRGHHHHSARRRAQRQRKLGDNKLSPLAAPGQQVGDEWTPSDELNSCAGANCLAGGASRSSSQRHAQPARRAPNRNSSQHRTASARDSPAAALDPLACDCIVQREEPPVLLHQTQLLSSCSCLSVYSAGGARGHQPQRTPRPVSSSSSQTAVAAVTAASGRPHPRAQLLVLGASGLIRQHSSQGHLSGWPASHWHEADRRQRSMRELTHGQHNYREPRHAPMATTTGGGSRRSCAHPATQTPRMIAGDELIVGAQSTPRRRQGDERRGVGHRLARMLPASDQVNWTSADTADTTAQGSRRQRGANLTRLPPSTTTESVIAAAGEPPQPQPARQLACSSDVSPTSDSTSSNQRQRLRRASGPGSPTSLTMPSQSEPTRNVQGQRRRHQYAAGADIDLGLGASSGEEERRASTRRSPARKSPPNLACECCCQHLECIQHALRTTESRSFLASPASNRQRNDDEDQRPSHWEPQAQLSSTLDGNAPATRETD